MDPRREILDWQDVEKLIDILLPHFQTEYDAMLIITRGGIVPGGMLAEAMDIEEVLIASVDFPAEVELDKKFFAWPNYVQFPGAELLTGKKVLVVDDVWGSGRTINSVKNRIIASGGFPETCVLHFNPHRNLFQDTKPDYFAAITDAHIIYPWEIDRGISGITGFFSDPEI